MRPWLLSAREEQLEPPGDWRVWLVLAGRGWGKTRCGAEWVIEQERRGARSIALVGSTAADVRDVMANGPSGLITCARARGLELQYEPSRRRVVWPSGATAWLYSAEEPDRLRGPQHEAAWCDELAAWSRLDETWSNLQLGLRLGAHPRAVVTTTPRAVRVVRELVEDERVHTTRGSTYDNAANLAPTYLAEVRRLYEGTRLGRQELHAELLLDVEGALWTQEMIERAHARAADSARRIVIGVDPSVAADGGGDECGIVVCASEGDGYAALADYSGRYSPAEWSARVARASEDHDADCVVAEVNNGGALVEQTLRAAGVRVRIRSVHASRGKRARAEPVAALYERGLVRHARGLDALERELTTWASASNDPSPNRLDALVWALYDLARITDGPRTVRERGYDW